jgi:hypothetical protein
MRPVNDLIKDAVKIYLDNWVFLIKAWLVSFALVLPLVLGFIPPAAAAMGVIFVKEKILVVSLAILFFLLFIILAAIIGSWSQTFLYQAIYQAAQGKQLSIKTMLQLAWKKLLSYLLASLASGFLILLGFLLFIIPGIILIVWFFLVSYVVVVEKTGPIQTLKRSKKLVKGHFWGVLGRLTLIFFLSTLVSALLIRLGFIGPIVNLLLSPLWMIFGYLIYQDLAKAKAA